MAEKEENQDKLIVTILCDTGERYLSTDLFKIKCSHRNYRSKAINGSGFLRHCIGFIFGLIGCFHGSPPTNQHKERSLSGAQLYATYCQSCHGPQATGRGSIPNLQLSQLNLDQFAQKLQMKSRIRYAVIQRGPLDSDHLPLYRYIKSLDTK